MNTELRLVALLRRFSDEAAADLREIIPPIPDTPEPPRGTEGRYAGREEGTPIG